MCNDVQQFFNSAGEDVTPRPLLAYDQRSQQGAAIFMSDSRSATVSQAFIVHQNFPFCLFFLEIFTDHASSNEATTFKCLK